MNNSRRKDIPNDQHQIVCPWWFCFTFDNFLRRLVQNPEKILNPYVKPGWNVLEVGPGMGYFTITLARLVGDSGKVIAADLQKEMLEGIRRRAIRAGVQSRIVLHLSQPDKIGINEPLDFGLVFWMLHEVSDQHRFLGEISNFLKPGGLLLLAEPRAHVSRRKFDESVSIAQSTGLLIIDQPAIFFSHTALFKKG